MSLDDIGPHVETIGNVGKKSKDDINGKESLGKVNTTDGRVIQRSLEPLIGMSIGGAIGKAHDISRNRANTLGTHGVALVSHGTRSNLSLCEWLLDFLQVGQETDVTAHLVRRLSDTRKDTEDIEIDLSRVCLSRNRNGLLEAHELANALVEGLDLLVITVEQLQKGCLGTGRSLDATHGQVLNFSLNPLEVKHEILHPQSTALTNGCQLSRLVVSEAKGRQVAVLGSELTEDADGLDQLALNELESIADLDNISVVSNVARGGTKMNDGHGRRGSLSVGMDVAHDIVTELLLLLGGILKVDIVQLGTHLLELLVANLNAKLLLGGSESSPKLAPRGELHGRRPHKGHLLGGISRFGFVLHIALRWVV